MAKLFKFADYKDRKGRKALSAQIAIKDMPCDQANFPTTLRSRAAKASTILQDAFNELAQVMSIQRDLVVGARLDPHKRHAVGVAMRRGEVDPNEIRPYMRKSLTLELPKVAIVGSCGVYEVNDDDTYLSRITQLTLATCWACETVGMEVYGVLMEGHLPAALKISQPYRTAQLAYMMVEPGRFTNLQAYAVALEREQFYMQGYKRAYYADDNAERVMGRLQGKDRLFWGHSYPGYNGGEGVHWARQHLEADLVIGIGQLTDVDTADISLGNRFDVEEACESMAAQARKLIRQR